MLFIDLSEISCFFENDTAKKKENLAFLCNAIATNKNLKVFKFNNNFSNEQNPADKELLLSTIHGLKSIEVLELNANNLCWEAEDVSKMREIIKDNVNLKKLNLNGNYFLNIN